MATIAEKLAELAITDDFNRTENPLLNVKGSAPNGTWVLLKPGKVKGKVATASPPGWTPDTTFATGNDGAYYSKTAFEPSGSQYIASLFRLTELPGESAPNRFIGVWILRDKAAPETKENGYYIRVEYLSGAGATIKLKIKLEKWVNGVVTVMKETETTASKYTKESRFAIVAGSGKVFAFASTGKATAFEQLLEVEDATYSTGYSAIYGGGTGTVAMQDFATGIFNLEEEPGIHKPNAATATASAPAPEISAPLQPSAASATASMPAVELAGGPSVSATEHEPGGLPLPFPSVLANPARLGPPRFTALDRKTLGID